MEKIMLTLAIAGMLSLSLATPNVLSLSQNEGPPPCQGPRGGRFLTTLA